MNFFLPIIIPKLIPPVHYGEGVYLTGSCFTEHITGFLNKHKFRTCQNSHGIMFNPLSVSRALKEVMELKKYTEADLFLLDEYWNSWFHHSEFSDLKAERVLEKINSRITSHHHFLKDARTLVITFGSAFAYRKIAGDFFVGNNHRAPAQWFRKELLEMDVIKNELNELQQKLQDFNPKLNIIFTISPVRHIRDGVIENNLSKARLLEAVHSMGNCYYFPAYEIVIDVLRDYRFYDADLVHPNYAATQYVWQQFVAHCIDESCYEMMEKMEQLYKAFHHRPKSVESKAHAEFLDKYYQLCLSYKVAYPILDFEKELHYFGGEP